MKMREVVDLALGKCFLWRSNALSSSPSIFCAGGGPILSLAGNPDSEYAVMVKYLYVSIGYHVHRPKCTVITDSESGDNAIQYTLTTVLAYLCKSQTRS